MGFGSWWAHIMSGLSPKKAPIAPPKGVKALVLSGGGTKGIFQLGALEHLLTERKERFKIVCGVSSGALNAMMVAQGPEYFEKLKAIWMRQAETDLEIIPERFTLAEKVIRAVLPGGIFYRKLGEMNGLEDNSRLLEAIEENTRDLQKNLKENETHLRIGVVSLQSGKYHALDLSDPALVPHTAQIILASTAIPIAFSPGTFPYNRSTQWIDGGVNQVTPIEDAIRVAQTQEIPLSEVVVVCSAPLETESTSREFKGLIEIGLRVEHILANQIDKQGFAIFQLSNVLLQLQESLESKWPRKTAAIDEIFKELLDDRYEFQKCCQGLRISLVHPDPHQWKIFREKVADRYPIEEEIDFWKEYPQTIERSGKRLYLAYEFGHFMAEKLYRAHGPVMIPEEIRSAA